VNFDGLHYYWCFSHNNKRKILGQSLGDTFWVAGKKKLIIDVAEVTGK
jgi:hypothetical protein